MDEDVEQYKKDIHHILADNPDGVEENDLFMLLEEIRELRLTTAILYLWETGATTISVNEDGEAGWTTKERRASS